MQALMLRALYRTPTLFKGAPISFSQHFSPYHHNHMFSSAKQQPQREMENQVLFSGEEDIHQGYRDIMVESYGVAYATRCSDEGYGEMYGERMRESLDKEEMKMSFGLAHATRCFGEGYKESYGESITLGNQHVGSDDMAKSFGLAYATGRFDEGYGDMYEESVEVVGKCGEGIEVLGNQNLEEEELVGSEDMEKSFGLAYATRCFDEGYGDMYGKSVEVAGKCWEGIKVLGQQNLEEKEHVGSEDMAKSFGLAYATRCFDEGYGDMYGESVEVVGKCGEDIDVLGNQNLEEKDLTKSFELAIPRGCCDKGYIGRHGDQNVDEKDMAESFGLAYATQCSDEGYGERYGESIKGLRHRKNAREMEIESHY